MEPALTLRIELPPPEVIAILRTKTSAERLEMAYDLHRFAGERLRAHLQFSHPQWNSEQISAEVARRLLWSSAT